MNSKHISHLMPQQILLGTALAATVALCSFGTAIPALAQNLKSLQSSAKPLVLKSRGSFYVGGESVEQSFLELGGRGEIEPSRNAADRVTVNQMYVEYMIPSGRQKVPVVLVHGAGLSGKSYDTTPDGRMGWFEYFVRKSHPVYVVDQVGRARSGFNQASLNRIGAGDGPRENFPKPWRFGELYGVWSNFRFGPRVGETFPESKYPVEAIGELAKQAIPDLTPLVPVPNPTHRALAELAAGLEGAVLIGHSQSGSFPMDAALINSKGTRALVAIEPGTCRSTTYTDAQIAQLAKVPTLVVYADNLPADTGFTKATWQDRFNDCSAYVDRIKAAKGHAEMLHIPALGIRGNSHMVMQDRNNLQIADLILKWIDANTRRQ